MKTGFQHRFKGRDGSASRYMTKTGSEDAQMFTQDITQQKLG